MPLHIHIATTDLWLALSGLIVGFVVGLTGMGGGALMTPIMVIIFKVQPLAAVSSDLVASLVMKPFGSAVHLRRGTVNWNLVKWLALGSVPSAFAGVLLLRALGSGSNLQNEVQTALGVALLVSAGTLVVKALFNLRARAHGKHLIDADAPVVVRPLPTVLIGVLGGLVVGMTSVGSGSLIIVLLLVVYPRLQANRLVGTDLVQAVPLVASAALGHVLFGDFKLGLTVALLAGSIPGVLIGAQVSAHANGRVVRRCLAFVLVASALKLLGASNTVMFVTVAAMIIVGQLIWLGVKQIRAFNERAALQQPQPQPQRPVDATA